jgi:LPXTG-motif cell wall-anchored protein
VAGNRFGWQEEGAAESGGAGVPAYEEAVVRNAVRKFVGVALVGLLGALALPVLAAGAQTDEPTTTTILVGGGCAVTVPPATQVAAGTQVSISGTAPDGVTVVLFVNGVLAQKNAPTDVVQVVVNANGGATGPWTLLYTPTANVTLSVNFTSDNGNSYTAVCADNAGRTEFPVTLAANAERPAAAALAFTGSSDTPSYVLIGIAAIVVGAVLVVAARRRSQVS